MDKFYKILLSDGGEKKKDLFSMISITSTIEPASLKPARTYKGFLGCLVGVVVTWAFILNL